MALPKVSLLVLLVTAASVLSASGQTEPYLVTKARLTRAAAVSATNDFEKANALVAQRAQDLNAADKALADVAATYNDALPLVNRLKNTLAHKLAAKDKTASVIPGLQESLDAAKAGLATSTASGADPADLASAVANAKQRADMTAQQVDRQKEALLSILDDMVAQAKSAQQALTKLQDAANSPSATLVDKSAVAAAQAALDAVVRADNDAAAAGAQATSDVSDAQASVPARSAAVTNAKIAQSKALAAKASADNAAAAMKSRMDAAVAVAESAESAAKTAGYSWTW
ncbi:unnamed protein product [Closterium sp. NIES-65]|nr:unnamed protein product [Closterium sp. NIES-65]